MQRGRDWAQVFLSVLQHIKDSIGPLDNGADVELAGPQVNMALSCGVRG
jgi:hypothetical protein